jgi:hypothetical protein
MLENRMSKIITTPLDAVDFTKYVDNAYHISSTRALLTRFDIVCSPIPVSTCATIATQVAWPSVAHDSRLQASILAFDLEGLDMVPVDWRLKYVLSRSICVAKMP